MNMFSMSQVSTKSQVEALIQNTYIEAVIFAAVAFFIALGIAAIIKWQGKPDRSYVKRRIWWIIIGVVFPFVFWIINAMYVSSFIYTTNSETGAKQAYAQGSAMFSTANVISTLVCLAVFVVVSIITMLIFRSSKWGSILGPTKNK